MKLIIAASTFLLLPYISPLAAKGKKKGGYIFPKSTALYEAAEAWTDDATLAATLYGPINTWDVSRVTNMDSLFVYGKGGNSFNSDISK